MADSSHRGTKIGPRIAVLVSQSIVATHRALVGTKHKLAMMIFRAISDEISEEVHLVMGPTLRKMLESDALHPDMHAHIDFLANAHGQLNALAGSSLAASSILSSIAQITNNALAPAVRSVLRRSPQLALDPVTLASIVARGIDTEADNVGDVEGQGFNAGQFSGLIELAYSYPAIADALDMYRRKFINVQQLTDALRRNGIPPTYIDAVVRLADSPVSPADAALALLRNNISQGEAENIASQWGISPESLNILVGNTGEPPGLMQLLEAYRRGFIDLATLQKGIRESRVRDEWIPTIEQLRYSPMSVADAVNAVVQNHLDEATAANYAQENGLEPSHFPILLNTAGEPLARGEMLELYNRGEVTKDQVIQAFRESRMKNKYNDVAFLLHERLLEPRMLSTAVEYGSATPSEALQNAMAYGYSKHLAEILVGEGTARKLQTYKNKVITAIETLYEDGGIDNTTAKGALIGLGSTADEAAFILEAGDMRRAIKQTEQVISAVRTKFLSRHIDDVTVTKLLTTAGVPTDQIAYKLAEWQIEQQAFTRQLTEAQIVKAVKLTLLTPEQGLARLIDLGYSQDDAALLIEGA